MYVRWNAFSIFSHVAHAQVIFFLPCNCDIYSNTISEKLERFLGWLYGAKDLFYFNRFDFSGENPTVDSDRHIYYVLFLHRTVSREGCTPLIYSEFCFSVINEILLI